jgi:predicted N-acyltransferase
MTEAPNKTMPQTQRKEREAADEVRITAVNTIAGVEPAAWDACANPHGLTEAANCPAEDPLQEYVYNPFISYGFLSALEESKSVGGRTGWLVQHLLLTDSHGTLLAAAPCYAKSHSRGEYVFDHAWADAYERAGGSYYPKLQIAVPFTPVTGRRLLVAAGPQAGEARAVLIGALRGLREAIEASSIHVTFPDRRDCDALVGAGYLERNGEQFHFFNPGYTDFDAFLAALASRKRKTIRRERTEALAGDVAVEWVTGAALTEKHWDAFFEFYMDTGSRKWGSPYLTRDFFTKVSAVLADRILLVLAKRNGRYIAGALNFIGDDALYGRNWGAIEERPFLHFELCYYQAIDFALKHGLKRVEAGAQGEHKLARGYRPVPTYSAHELADQRLSDAVADYLRREREAVKETIAYYDEHAPFKKGDDTSLSVKRVDRCREDDA